MDKLMILIAGMPGAGKTRYANYLSDKIQVPFICKDKLKEIIWEKVRYDTRIREQSQKHGMLAYDLAYHFCEMLMKTGQGFVFESNFVNQCTDYLQPLTDKYGYKAVTVLFEGDARTIHARFIQRDVTDERHPGLVSNGFFNDFEYFVNATEQCRSFSFGEAKITVDATDFADVSYEKITNELFRAIEKKQP